MKITLMSQKYESGNGGWRVIEKPINIPDDNRLRWESDQGCLTILDKNGNALAAFRGLTGFYTDGFDVDSA